MTDLTLMTFASDPATVLPSLVLLSHRVRVLPMDAASLVKMPENTILFLDARDDLATAKTLCRLIHASGLSTPIVLILTEGGFTAARNQIVLDNPIKSVGLHEVKVQLHPEVRSKVTLNVARNADEAERQARGEDVCEMFAQAGIQCGKRLVQKQQPGLGGKASGQGNPLRLAARQRGYRSILIAR